MRHHPALAGLAGASSAVLAVPDAARAYTVAGLAHLSDRHPVVVAMPTSTEAERLAHDLRAFLGAEEVDLFPAWETLPFERVSPGVEAMGWRLRTMWRLRDPARMPRVLVAPVRSLVQRLGPHVEEVEPVVVTRGEVAQRGLIVDIFASTADVPVRIDLWGDEIDRLTMFSCQTVKPLNLRSRGSQSVLASSRSRPKKKKTHGWQDEHDKDDFRGVVQLLNRCAFGILTDLPLLGRQVLTTFLCQQLLPWWGPLLQSGLFVGGDGFSSGGAYTDHDRSEGGRRGGHQ